MEENGLRLSMPDASSGDWRSQVSPEDRQRIVDKILAILKKLVPNSEPECVNELQKIAFRFENKMYTSAKNLSDYLRKICQKMLLLERDSQHPGGPGQINPSINQIAVDSASLGMANLSLH